MAQKRKELEEEENRMHNIMHPRAKIQTTPPRPYSGNLGDQLA